MPIFEYVCQKCQHEFEALVLSSGSAEPHCPKCDSAELGTKFSAFSPRATSAPAPRAAGPCGGCPTPGACSMN